MYDASEQARADGRIGRADRLKSLFEHFSDKTKVDTQLEQIFGRFTQDPINVSRMLGSLESRLRDAIIGTEDTRLSPEQFAAHLILLHEDTAIPSAERIAIASRLRSQTASDNSGARCLELVGKTPAEIKGMLPDSLVSVPELGRVHTSWIRQQHLEPLLGLAKAQDIDVVDLNDVRSHFEALQRGLGSREAIRLVSEVESGTGSVLAKLKNASRKAANGQNKAKTPDQDLADKLNRVAETLEELVDVERSYADENGYRHKGATQSASDEPWILASESVDPIARLAQSERFITNSEFDTLLRAVDIERSSTQIQRQLGTAEAIKIFKLGLFRRGTRWGPSVIPALQAKILDIASSNPYQAGELKKLVTSIKDVVAKEAAYKKSHRQYRYEAPEPYGTFDPRIGMTRITASDVPKMRAEVERLIASGELSPEGAMVRLEAIRDQANKRAEALIEPHYVKLMASESLPAAGLYGESLKLRRALKVARNNGKVEKGKFVTRRRKTP